MTYIETKSITRRCDYCLNEGRSYTMKMLPICSTACIIQAIKGGLL